MIKVFFTIFFLFSITYARPGTYQRICQLECNGAALACYNAAVKSFGTGVIIRFGVETPIAVGPCVVVQGICLEACKNPKFVHSFDKSTKL